METAKDVYGSVLERGGAVLMARIVDSGGQPIDPVAVAQIRYTISDLRTDPPGGAVAGHSGAPLQVGDVFSASLRTDAAWTVDSTGYNFRHEIDTSEHQAFPDRGANYEVRYELTPSAGQVIVFRFQLRAI